MNRIPDTDRDQIKQNILALMLSVPPKIRKIISISLTIIGESDFPAHWKTLLPVFLLSKTIKIFSKKKKRNW